MKGSEKQVKWAEDIIAGWLSHYDSEISNQKSRPESDEMSKYVTILENNREKLVSGFEKVDAKQIIDLFTAKINPAQAMINSRDNRNTPERGVSWEI